MRLIISLQKRKIQTEKMTETTNKFVNLDLFNSNIYFFIIQIKGVPSWN